MDSQKIKAIVIVVLALFAALYLGITAATAQMETIIWVVGGVAITICLLLGRRIYLIIPLMTSLGLVLPLPGTFDTGLIGQGIFLVFVTLLFLSRQLPMRGGFTELEFWCLLLIASVAQAYIRNPVGLQILGFQEMGGKAYGIFGVTIITSLFLSLLLINPRDFKIWVLLSFVGNIFNFIIGSIGWFFPTVGYYLGATFSTDLNRSESDDQATRIGFVRGISVGMATWISSRTSPLRACFHPIWLPLILFAFACAAVSGFRSQLIHVGLIFLLGIAYRGGIRSALVSLTLGALALFLLAFVNLIAPLPPNIQRSLSFLPGTWDQALTADADNSTDWRVEMWKEALLTDTWITNKTFGDGLGISKQEHDRMLGFTENKMDNSRGMSGLTIQQETMMIAGGYHSGPVQTVRTTGYIGLAIMLLAMIRVAVHAHRQIIRTRGTEWFPVALFIGIPLIAQPLFWTLVFGTFDKGAAGILMGAAILRMLEKNLPLPPWQRRDHQPFNLRNRTGSGAIVS
jgi:hypothetical protein